MRSTALAWGASVLLSAVLGATVIHALLTSRHDAEIAKLLETNARALQAAQEDALNKERAARETAKKLETEHAQKLKTLEGDAARLRSAIAAFNARADDRMRRCADASAARLPAGGGAAVPPDGAGASAHDSDTDQLLRAAMIADRTAEYAALCYEWVRALEE